MKEIKQGTLYGFDLVLKVPKEFEDDELINGHTLSRHLKEYYELKVK